MKKENLINIQNEYNKLKKIRKEQQDAIERKNKLEQSPQVKEYFELLDEIESWGSHYYTNGIFEMSDKKLLEKAIDTEKITESNKIFVYMGTYQYSDEIDIVHGASDYRLRRNASCADYNIYADIEKDRSDSQIKVPISQCEEFEKNNIVLIPKKMFFTEDYYREIREAFFSIAVEYGQDIAKEKIMAIKNI